MQGDLTDAKFDNANLEDTFISFEPMDGADLNPVV